MTIQLRQAERLCSAAELSLVKAALAPALRKLDEKQLAAYLTRARRARDKHRDLLQRQRLDSRDRTGQKAGRSGDANARTRAKAELFQEVLERFESRSLDLGGREGQQSDGMTRKRATKKKTAKKAATKKAATKKAATKKAATKKAATKKAATKKAATNKAATKKAATKKAATKKAATKKAATKKAAKRRDVVEPDEDELASSHAATGSDGGPVVKTPAERVAEKVRANLHRSEVARQASDPGVTDRHGARFVSDRAKVAAQQAGSQGARERAMHGHIGSAVRRNQAKRDKR
jgi:hypothetical protein